MQDDFGTIYYIHVQSNLVLRGHPWDREKRFS